MAYLVPYIESLPAQPASDLAGADDANHREPTKEALDVGDSLLSDDHFIIFLENSVLSTEISRKMESVALNLVMLNVSIPLKPRPASARPKVWFVGRWSNRRFTSRHHPADRVVYPGRRYSTLELNSRRDNG